MEFCIPEKAMDYGRKRETPPGTAARERGSSMIAILALLVTVGAAVMTFMVYNEDSNKVIKARASGWHMATVAKAARLYVRNNSLDPSVFPGVDNNGDGLQDTALNRAALAGPAPRAIAIADLIDAGLLPENFPVTNALGQTVRVFAANYPVRGPLTDPATVATAYVYLEDNQLSSPALMQYAVQEAGKHGLAVMAPVFSGTANLSDCDGDGTPEVGLWDSDCMNEADFRTLTGAANFAPGSLIVPAWKAMTHDPRAVMRYPQPENTGGGVMMTNLEMGTPVTDLGGNCLRPVEVWQEDDTGGYVPRDTGLCEVEQDNAALGNWRDADRRYDLENVNNVQIRRLVATNQGASEVRVQFTGGGAIARTDGDNNPALKTMAVANASEVLSIAGELNSQHDLRVTGIMPNPTLGVGPYTPSVYFADAAGNGKTVLVEKNLTVSQANGTAGMEVRGDITTDALYTGGTVTANNASTFGTITVQTYNAPNGLTVSNIAQVGLLNANGQTIRTQDMNVRGATELNTLTVNGDMNVYNITTPTASVAGDVDVMPPAPDEPAAPAVLHDVETTGDTSIENCTGTCPDITGPPGV